MEKSSLCFNQYPLYMILLILLEIIVGVGAKEYNRYNFPPDFIFGAGTSSYQVEGAAFEDGRKPSIFDTFAHSSKYLEGNGDVASDGYHKYKKDVELMAETGLDAYRFSISWSRLIPDGRGAVNPQGVEYYNNLINELIDHGIQPHATLMHLDHPQALEDEYGGFINKSIVVQNWTTINEANVFVLGGYDSGDTPPGRCSYPFGNICTKENSTTQPYLATHNILLAHASATKLYRDNYQAKQHGFVGFSLYGFHFIPSTNSTEDAVATQRANDFVLGWFMNPLIYGDYPNIMKKNVGNRLPTFTHDQSKLVKGAFDFIGLNYYTVTLVENTKLVPQPRDYKADMATKWTYYNQSTGSPTEISSYPIIPWGLQGVLEHFKNIYDNPPIYIYENGQMTDNQTILNDLSRIEYLQSHIGGLLDAVRNGSNAKGYFVWSFVDVFEVLFGHLWMCSNAK